jgi:glycosyltransferase involved in cell wall biosynthesis
VQPESLVTALVPVRAYSSPYLTDAIESLQQQTSPTWQSRIVVEPRERAGIESGLGSLLDDPRIVIIENEGRNLAGAFNTGMRTATTEFVAILLADDLWTPDAVAVLEREIRDRPTVDFFHSARRVIDDDGESISSVHPPTPTVTLADFQTRSPVKHLLCWRRAMAIDIGGMDESLNSVGPDDLDFPWTMAERGATFGAVEDCLYQYRDHRSHYRLTTHLPRSVHRRELARIFRKHGVPPALARQRIRAATNSYLRQCLYRSPIDEWWRRALGRPPKTTWRDRYR